MPRRVAASRRPTPIPMPGLRKRRHPALAARQCTSSPTTPALDHAKNETTFLGAAHADARLWQGNNAVTAPTIVLSRARQLLTATGPAGGVKAALVESGSGRKAKSASPAATGPSVIRTSSSMLVYSGGERKVTLSGGVTAQNATGTIKASVVELFLNPNAPRCRGENQGGCRRQSHGSRWPGGSSHR